MNFFKALMFAALVLSGNAFAEDVINGLWDGDCKKDYRWSLQFGDDGEFRQILELLPSNDCQVHDLVDYRDGPYNVTYGENGTFQISWRIDSYFRVLKAENLVRIYNAGGYCGFSDWRLNEPKDLTGIDCAGSKHGPTDYSEIDGYLNQDVLYLGKTSSGEDAPWYRR